MTKYCRGYLKGLILSILLLNLISLSSHIVLSGFGFNQISRRVIAPQRYVGIPSWMYMPGTKEFEEGYDWRAKDLALRIFDNDYEMSIIFDQRVGGTWTEEQYGKAQRWLTEESIHLINELALYHFHKHRTIEDMDTVLKDTVLTKDTKAFIVMRWVLFHLKTGEVEQAKQVLNKLLNFGIKEVSLVDSQGVIHKYLLTDAEIMGENNKFLALNGGGRFNKEEQRFLMFADSSSEVKQELVCDAPFLIDLYGSGIVLVLDYYDQTKGIAVYKFRRFEDVR